MSDASARARVRGRGAIGTIALAALVLGLAVVPTTAANAATFSLSATRASSGTSTADAASTCPSQGDAPETHCAGYDVSLAAVDQILRTGDSAQVRFDFAFDGSDTGVVLRSTLPEGNGGPLAVWTGMPAACAAGSTFADGNRTINCLISDPQGPGDGSVTATFALQAYAYDGTTFTVPATIESDSSAPVSATSSATFTSSSAPMWNLVKNHIANTLPGPFFYRGAGGEPGFAIPTSTLVAAGKVGGYSPLAGPVTWTETMSSPTVDTSSFRLLNWGNYGVDGCGADGAAADPPVAGYASHGVGVSNQYNPVGGARFDCEQTGGAGSPVQVTWQNPPAVAGGFPANVWIMMWVPLDAVPENSTVPAPTVTASGFDPDDVNGVSNYLDDTEPEGNNAAAHGQIVNADNRQVTKRPIRDYANPFAHPAPGTDGSTLRDESFVSLVTFQNTGTTLQTPVQVCDVIDVTTQRLSPFEANGSVPADTYAVAVTQGPVGDPITAPPYRPAADYNNTDAFGVDPSAYVVEFAAGEIGGTTPTEAPLPATAFDDVTCGDGDAATAWHEDPTHQEFVDYAATLGLTDPLDVVNRVRVTFIGGAIEPDVTVGVKVHTTTRAEYRAATTQAGETIYATTLIGDVAVYDYPQITIDPWSATRWTGPRIAGRIDVDTAVSIVSADPPKVQAGDPTDNRTTFTLRALVGFGENVATTQPLRVVHHLPPGLRYVTGSASIEPDHVLARPDGATVIVWDLGDVTGVTNQVTTLPDWTFVAEADPLAPTPDVNWSTVIAESVSPSGEQIDEDLPIVNCGGFLDVTIPPTPNVPVETTTDVPPPGNYAGCFGQGRNRRMDYQPVEIGNAFLSLAAYKSALEPLVESGADDGVAGAEVGWDLTYENTTSNDFPGVDIVDVLPYPGDGRDPESDFAGTVELAGIETTDTLSSTPNGLPVSETVQPPRDGTTFYVTDRASAEIERDPYADSNLEGGSTAWCLLDDVGEPGCPAMLADVTAVRVISGLLATQEAETVRLGFATDGAEAGDLMTNTATARVISVLSVVEISGDAIRFAASSVSGTVWEDANADGVIDATEDVRLGGVMVELTGTASTSGQTVDRSVLTEADGTYSFAGLPAGTYTVTVDEATARTVDPAYALASDPDGVVDGGFDVTLPLGTAVTARDFGFATSSLSGVVFADPDNDGTIDAGEDLLEGVTVTLTGTDDLGADVNRTETTNVDGEYVFAGLRPGDYDLTVTPPAGTIAGRSVAGTSDGTEGALGAGSVTAIDVAAGENATGYRFGMLEPEVVSGAVFVDTDGDGIRDAGEPGISGVTITLSGGDGDLTTQTDADGLFAFGGLLPGDYTLTETQPTAYLNGTTSTNGSVGTVDGDRITGIVVGDGSDTDGYTFGEFPPGSISGVVYHDLNADGVRDAGEPGIAGAEVTLSGDATAGPVTTNADGEWSFDGLAPGSYAVTSTEADGYLDGLESAGDAGGVVGTVSGANAISGIDLSVGEHASGYLFGDVQAASLAGVVFDDADGDGELGASESGIGDVTVDLTGTDMFGASVELSGTTSPDGGFSFADLLPGEYTLTETQPSGYADGIDSVGSAGGTLADDAVTGIDLGSGESGTDYLFAERALVSLSGGVFADLNADGVWDPDEAGVPDVTITIESDDGATTDTATSGVDGSWSFTGLPPGTYTVTEEGQPLDGYIDGDSVPGTAGGTAGSNEISDIELSGSADGYLFAEIPLSLISGTVWHDADDDGMIDAGETPLEGVEIALGGDEERTVLTAADGTFVFAGLVPGTYTLTEQDLDDWADGATLVGDAGGTAATNQVTGIQLDPGVNASGYGFGERAAELQLTVTAQTLDAQVETGPYVPVGDPVRLVYTIVNNGDTALDEIVVLDDVLGAVTCDSARLAAHSEMDCVAETTALAGQHVHSGRVTAAVVPRDAGGPGLFAITQLAATDVAHYFGMVASAELSASVEGEESGTSPGPVFESGRALGVVVTIANTGNVPLTLDDLETADLGALDCGADVTVPVGESIECTLERTPSAGNYAFPLAATLSGPAGTDVDGQPVETEIEAMTTLFFQVLEPGVEPPGMADSGVDTDLAAVGTAVLLLILGGAGLLAWGVRRRQTA